MRRAVPESRLRAANDAPVRADGDFVLYWLTASRRVGWSFALEHAVGHARELGRPLVILEALRCGYRFASDRIHRFVLDGMAANARALRRAAVLYHPYLERRAGEGKGLLAELGQRACLVVGDDAPVFFLPRATAAAARQLRVRFELVDGNGLLPLRATDRVFATAHAFRRFLQRELPARLTPDAFPLPSPLRGARLPRLAGLPAAIARRWPAATLEELESGATLAALPIDHGVPVVALRGGAEAAARRWQGFLARGLARYEQDRNNPSVEGASGLSPYLHFGQISPHQIAAELLDAEGWSLDRVLGAKADGARAGFWGTSAAAEAFLDQLVTWRELGLNHAWQHDDPDRLEHVPEWALATLRAHRRDRRPHRYPLDALAAAGSHDAIWNAAQRELLREGRIHNYLRMLWGKKILEWSDSPEAALAIMLELNNRFALDGRDPNSTSGIHWILGRYDRPWGPERPIFGTVRYMSSENTRRKLDLRGYLARFGT
jgi:deoxyribodipyrimidine photo-lyase